MPVDIAFELGYLLSEELGVDVEVVGYEYDPVRGELCVEAVVGGATRRACAPVRQCKGLEGPRLERCLSKSLAQGRAVEELAERLRGEGGG